MNHSTVSKTDGDNSRRRSIPPIQKAVKKLSAPLVVNMFSSPTALKTSNVKLSSATRFPFVYQKLDEK
jgi:hypothetical protein